MDWEIDWEAIKAATNALLVSKAKKLEGDKFIIYKVGEILRIDLKK